MISWLNPLRGYKKYLLCEEILRQSCASFMWYENESHEPLLKTAKAFPTVFVAMFTEHGKKHDPLRILEALKILEANKHVTTLPNPNLYKYGLTPTLEGEAALHEGFYKKKVYKFWAVILLSPIGVFGVIKIILTIAR